MVLCLRPVLLHVLVFTRHLLYDRVEAIHIKLPSGRHFFQKKPWYTVDYLPGTEWQMGRVNIWLVNMVEQT